MSVPNLVRFGQSSQKFKKYFRFEAKTHFPKIAISQKPLSTENSTNLNTALVQSKGQLLALSACSHKLWFLTFPE